MPVPPLTVTAALAALHNGALYIDVRSSAEYAQGHPAGAINVPLLDADEDTGQVLPNPDFVRVMKANFAPDALLVIGCESGSRSGRAAQMLEVFGFVSASNVVGGYVGWCAAGHAVETSAPAGHAYADLLARAENNSHEA
ncbi:MAG: rhodanese-like domain-containing protein [Acidobacteria bacterium]|nr:rhodanese-like domain-containing protein [Acidobacteriota bacterium]